MQLFPARPGGWERGSQQRNQDSAAVPQQLSLLAIVLGKCQRDGEVPGFQNVCQERAEKLNRGLHPSYPSAMNDLLGLLSASQSFHTTFCPAIYLREKQKLNSLSGCREGKNAQGKADFRSTAGTVQSITQAPQEQQNWGSLLSPELFDWKFSSQAHNRSAILTGCSFKPMLESTLCLLRQKSCF